MCHPDLSTCVYIDEFGWDVWFFLYNVKNFIVLNMNLYGLCLLLTCVLPTTDLETGVPATHLASPVRYNYSIFSPPVLNSFGFHISPQTIIDEQTNRYAYKPSN